ncbi:kelch-like protein 24 [Chanos chanos]|uniref:Kelch-like protein 24 n=1 Tax=Chanos chanos TaxID=29144 RepID=A0A6J2WUU2_CHACN|nr:kelch-like protein 24 [Chanos chanos]
MGFGGNSDTPVNHTTECISSYAENILQILNMYRKSGIFTDIVLQVDGCEFPCHRAVLSASSPYFHTMFNSQMLESTQSVIQIQVLSRVAMEDLLNFLYEGRVDLNEDNVETVYQAADFLGVSVLCNACIQFLEKRVNHSNCLGIMDFASSYLLRNLAETCQNLLNKDFVKVYKHKEFLRLPKERIVELLMSEQLQIQREEVLVEAVLKWVHHEPSDRKAALRELLELVRLPLVDPSFFVNSVETDDILQDCRDCRPLLLEARRYHTFGREIYSARTKPRRSSGTAEVIMIIGGCDRNGFSRLSHTEKYNPFTGEWTSAAHIPGHSKSEFASSELQNDVYVSGGQLNSSDVWRYMVQLNQWVRVGNLKKGRWRHKMATLLGKLYAVGGYNGHERLSSVECYSAFDNQWLTVAPLLLPVSSAAVTSCAGKLYVIGGAVNEDSNTNKVQCYDPVQDQWTFVATCPFSQRCISAVTLNNTIYVVGGLLDKIYTYNPSKDTWSKAATLPMKVESCGLTVCDGKIYVVGGRDEYSAALNYMWAFNPETNTVTKEKSLPRSVSYHGCVTITQRCPQKS